ncbi:MAG TPA: hypothetical protein VFA10_11660 [Ktedonobacteraceae bacterium]|nr:hypothetical protein [Ktedonobacteraceae bacterium]
MRTIYSIRRRFFLISLLSLAFTFVLTACGSNTGTGAGNPSGSPTTVQGYGSAYGCPSDAVVTTAPSTPNVMVHPSQANTTIIAHTGDVIEIQLPFGHQWRDRPTSQNVLELQTPAGYAWKANNVCVWRFVAKGPGTATLGFENRALCKQGQLCPQYVMYLPFTIEVK